VFGIVIKNWQAPTNDIRGANRQWSTLHQELANNEDDLAVHLALWPSPNSP